MLPYHFHIEMKLATVMPTTPQQPISTSLNGLVWMKRTIRAWLASKVSLAVSRAAGQISLSHCVKQESSRIFLALNMFTQQISVSSTDMADSTEVSDGQTRPQRKLKNNGISVIAILTTLW